jgi:hypothetical protein
MIGCTLKHMTETHGGSEWEAGLKMPEFSGMHEMLSNYFTQPWIENTRKLPCKRICSFRVSGIHVML